MKKEIQILFFLFFINYNYSQTAGEKDKIIFQNESQKSEYILTETKEGGKLDFFTSIKGKEYNGFAVKPKLFMTNIEFALYSWGKKCKELGIETIENTLDLFSKFKGRELNRREKDIIPMGFENKLEL